jgi:hypothetical protein
MARAEASHAGVTIYPRGSEWRKWDSCGARGSPPLYTIAPIAAT